MINPFAQQFFLGVVENRNDPKMMGRCKIRVVGVHTPDKVELPIEGLPWAVPVQPITSAAMSGIGHSPVGPVEGTWCLVIFTDPESKQQPMFLGTVGGMPTKENIYDDVTADVESPTGNLVDSSGNPVTDGSGNPITTGSHEQVSQAPSTAPTTGAVGAVGQMTGAHLSSLLAVIRKRESSNNYSAVNSLGYSGAYQFGMAMLEDLGYVEKGSWSKWKKNKYLELDELWSGKEGCTSRATFLANTSAQDNAAKAQMQLLFNRMKKGNLVSDKTPPEKLAGMLMVSHLKGTGKGGARDFLSGTASPDAFGTSPGEYYKLGYASVKATQPASFPTRETIDYPDDEIKADSSTIVRSENGQPYKVASSPAAKRKGDPSKLGFIDPNLKYPLQDHIGEPDTNRLARHQSIEKTVVGEKQTNRVLNVSIANSTTTWDQPNVPYAASYPFNHVYQSESGHLLEFDDTPKSERVHLLHRTGSFIEIDATGSRVDRVIGSQYTIIEDDGMLYIRGTGAITIDGDFSVDIKKSLQLNVYDDAQIHVYGDVRQTVNGDYDVKCKNFRMSAAESIHMTSGTTTNIKSGADYNVSSAADINTSSGGQTSHKAGGMVTNDGSQFHMNSGNSKTAAQATPANAIEAFTPSLVLNDAPSYEQVSAANNETYHGDPMPAVPPPKDPAKLKPEDVGTIEFPLTRATRLSANFTIGDLCNSSMLPAKMIPTGGQYGLSDIDIALNLQALAVNVIEPIFAMYPDMIITSGLRSGSGKSQHDKGQAFDMNLKSMPQGTSAKKQFYADVAAKIKNIVPYDQLLFEYRDSGAVWLHISYSRVKNRSNILTLANDKTVGSGIIV